MVPDFIDKPHERELWDEPWKVDPHSSRHKTFKAKLWDHGYLSPHFKRDEAASRADGCNCPREPIPEGTLRIHAQYHAFCLEQCRHILGDKPLTPVSWYRAPCHNRCVGGATQSQHMSAWATDWNSTGDAFDAAFERVFSGGGRGYQGVVGGRIRHVDNGPARVWVYA